MDEKQQGVKAKPMSRLVAEFEDGEKLTVYVSRNPKKVLTLEWFTLDPDAKEGRIANRENALVNW